MPDEEQEKQPELNNSDTPTPRKGKRPRIVQKVLGVTYEKVLKPSPKK